MSVTLFILDGLCFPMFDCTLRDNGIKWNEGIKKKH